MNESFRKSVENAGSKDSANFPTRCDEEDNIKSYKDAIPEDRKNTAAEASTKVKIEAAMSNESNTEISTKRSIDDLMYANIENSKSVNSINSITITEKSSEIKRLENLLVQNQDEIRIASEKKESYNNRYTQQRAELERTILLLSMKKEAINTQLKYLTRNCRTTRKKEECLNFGSVIVENLIFLCRHSKRKNKNKGWYVCTISCGIEVFATKPTRPDADKNLTFHEQFEINPRSSQFEITIGLYKLKLKPNLEPTSFKTIKTHRLSLPSPPRSSTTETCFISYGITLVHTSDIRKGHFCLFQLPKPSMIYNCLSASFNTKLTLNEVHKGFINFGRKTRPDKAIEWEWVWCCLKGKVIKCFVYPDHEEECKPLVVLELDTCASEVVRVQRPKTLLLEIMENHGEESASTKIFLSSYSTDEIKSWEKSINNVVNLLKNWNFSTET